MRDVRTWTADCKETVSRTGTCDITECQAIAGAVPFAQLSCPGVASKYQVTWTLTPAVIKLTEGFAFVKERDTPRPGARCNRRITRVFLGRKYTGQRCKLSASYVMFAAWPIRILRPGRRMPKRSCRSCRADVRHTRSWRATATQDRSGSPRLFDARTRGYIQEACAHPARRTAIRRREGRMHRRISRHAPPAAASTEANLKLRWISKQGFAAVLKGVAAPRRKSPDRKGRPPDTLWLRQGRVQGASAASPAASVVRFRPGFDGTLSTDGCVAAVVNRFGSSCVVAIVCNSSA